MRKLLAIGTISVALFAACGNDGGTDAATDAANDDPYASAASTDEMTLATDEASPKASAPIAAGGDCTDNSTAEGPGDLEMQNFQFAPPCLQINSGQGLRLHNEGSVAHNFSVENFGLDVDVQPGQENNTEATGLEPGSYTIFCKFHRESNDMEGTLKIVAQ